MSDSFRHPEALPVATAISYAGADLSGFTRGQKWCGGLSICLAMLSLLISGVVGLTQGISVRRMQQSISQQPARIALLNQQRQKMRSNAAAAQQWLDQQAVRAPMRGLTEAEADALVASIQGHNAQWNQAQMDSLKRELQRVGQRLVDPDIAYTTNLASSASPEQRMASRQRSGAPGEGRITLDVRLVEPFGFAAVSTLEMDADGTVTSRHVENIASATTRYSTLLPVTAISTGFNQTRRLWQSLASLLATTLNFALAVMLLLAGIAALQRRAAWVRMHRLYAIAKIAVVLLTAGCIYWTFGVSRDGLDLKLAGVYILCAALYPLSLLMRLP